MKHIPALVAVAIVLALPSARASAAPEPQSRIVSVDYVLALMDAGIDQKEIVRRIVEKDLAFRLEPDDLDRLREAGCGEALIEVVSAEQDSSAWEHPRRLESNGAPTNDRYAPGYLSFSYGYPYYYYDPFYYPYYDYPSYGFNVYYSSPFHHVPRHSFRSAPRGSWGGGFSRHGGTHFAPRGSSPRSSPRGSHHH